MSPVEKHLRELHPEWSDAMIKVYTPPIVQDERPAVGHPLGDKFSWVRGVTADGKTCWV